MKRTVIVALALGIMVPIFPVSGQDYAGPWTNWGGSITFNSPAERRLGIEEALVEEKLRHGGFTNKISVTNTSMISAGIIVHTANSGGTTTITANNSGNQSAVVATGDDFFFTAQSDKGK